MKLWIGCEVFIESVNSVHTFIGILHRCNTLRTLKYLVLGALLSTLNSVIAIYG